MPITLVTGGAGFIGSHVVEKFLAQGHMVRVFDDLSTGATSNLPSLNSSVSIIKGSILDRQAIAEAVVGCDFVIHLAAKISVPESIEHPAEYMEVLVTGSAIVLDECRKAHVKRVVLASSAAVYGTEVEPPHVEATLSSFRSSPYAVGKLAMEDLARDFSKRGLPCVCLRLFNVFGPRQNVSSGYAAAIPAFISSVIKGHDLTVFGDGFQTRDFTYVENVAEAFFRAATLPGVGGSYNIGSGKPTTVNELAELILAISQVKVQIVHVPERPGDIKPSFADTTRALKHLGVREAITLPEGLSKTWQWFKKTS